MNRKSKQLRLQRVRHACRRLRQARANEMKYATAYFIGLRMQAEEDLRKAWRK